MDLNRRSFLRGVLAVTAVSITPTPLIAADVPQIVGNGIHDDTAGIQAAIDGQPFVCEGQLIAGTKEISLGAGTYRVSKTLRVVGRDRIRFTGAHFLVAHSDPFVYFEGSTYCRLHMASVKYITT